MIVGEKQALSNNCSWISGLHHGRLCTNCTLYSPPTLGGFVTAFSLQKVRLTHHSAQSCNLPMFHCMHVLYCIAFRCIGCRERLTHHSVICLCFIADHSWKLLSSWVLQALEVLVSNGDFPWLSCSLTIGMYVVAWHSSLNHLSAEISSERLSVFFNFSRL